MKKEIQKAKQPHMKTQKQKNQINESNFPFIFVCFSCFVPLFFVFVFFHVCFSFLFAFLSQFAVFCFLDLLVFLFAFSFVICLLVLFVVVFGLLLIFGKTMLSG